MNLHLVVLLTILLPLAFAGSRVTLSLFAISLQASPCTVGVIMSLLAALPMLFSVRAEDEAHRPQRAKRKRPATALARDGRPGNKR